MSSISQGLDQDSPQPAEQQELRRTPTQKDDIDYFEKFTLVDVVGPGEPAAELQDQAEQLPVKAQSEEQKPAKTTSPEDISAPENSFVIVSDVDIVGEHLDEVFYGEKAPSDGLHQRDLQAEDEAAAMRMRRESQKESGSVLFGSEETVLTPIFISPGPPKIIDPILLEEPTAMSFMYSDLYEDAVGERRKSDEEHSEAESVASEKTYKRRLSDSDEADGYLEKFTLKDEIPTVAVRPETPEDQTDGRMMWSQSKFEMTGCLTRVISDLDKEKTKMEEPETTESIVVETSEDIKSETFEDKRERVLAKVKGKDEKELYTETEEMSSGEATTVSLQESKLKQGQQTGHQEIKHKAKTEQTKTEESSTAETHSGAEQVDCKEEKCEDQGEVLAESAVTEGDQLSQTEELEDQVISKTAESAETTTPSAEMSCISHPSNIPSETSEKLSEEAASDCLTHSANEMSATEAQTELKELEVEGQGTCLTAEIEMSEKTLLHEEEALDVVPNNVASVEVIADCESSVHALVELSEKTVDEKEIQTHIQIDLQEIKQYEAEAAGEAAVLEEEHRDLVAPTMAEDQLVKSVTKAEQGSEDRTVAEAIKPGMPEEVKTYTPTTQHDIETKTFPPQGTEAEGAATNVKPTLEQTSLMDVQEMVKDELIVLVPKGQSVEMDIEMGQRSEKTASESMAPPEVHTTFEDLTEPQASTTTETEQEAKGETQVEPQLGVTDNVIPNKSSDEACNAHLPLAPVLEDNKEEQKVELDTEKDKAFFPPLRSFSAQEDLSAPHTQDMQLDGEDVEEKTVEQIEDSVMDANIVGETPSQEIDLHTELKESKTEEVPEPPEVMVEEPEYEVIYEKDAKETQRDEEKATPEPAQEMEEEKIEVVMEEEQRALSLSAEDELIEADYDIIDAEEERQARLAAELQGMDWFCLTCGSLLAESDCASEEHHGHQVTSVDSAYEEIKVRCCKNFCFCWFIKCRPFVNLLLQFHICDVILILFESSSNI